MSYPNSAMASNGRAFSRSLYAGSLHALATTAAPACGVCARVASTTRVTSSRETTPFSVSSASMAAALRDDAVGSSSG